MKMKKTGGLILLVCLCFAPAQGQEKTRTSSSTTTTTVKDDSISGSVSESRWSHTSADGKTEISIGGKQVQFNDDYTDVESIAGDGYFRISEEREGMMQRLEIMPEANGGLKRLYTRGGEVRPFDNAARMWLAKVLSEAVAGSGYDAEARVGKILKKSGVNGVLSEIGRVKGDYARRVYASALIDQGNLNGGQLAKLLSLRACLEIKPALV